MLWKEQNEVISSWNFFFYYYYFLCRNIRGCSPRLLGNERNENEAGEEWRERRLGSFHPVGFYGLCVYHFRFSNQRKREKRNIYLISALLAICYCISGYSGAILRSRLIIFFIFSPPQSFTRTRMVRSTNASSQSYSSGRGSTALAGV